MTLTPFRCLGNAATPLASALLVSSLLAGCGALTQTPYVAPATSVPAGWSNAKDAATGNFSGEKWWRHFDDATLDQLIDDALLHNNNLAVAAIKVKMAQLQAGIAADALVPALSSNTSTSYNRPLRNNQGSYKASSTAVTLSYQADLWGNFSQQVDAKKWEAIATEQDRASAALTVISTTANIYWQLAYVNQRLALNLESIKYAEKTLALVRTQHQAGAVSALEVLEAEQSLANQESTRTTLLQQKAEAANSLALLFDGPPEKTYADPPRLPQQQMPELAPGLPAGLLSRRPDLRAAELRLRESLANVDVTRTSYYPTLTLTGSAGGTSQALRDVLLNPVATLGAGIVLPFLQWNQMQLNIKVSQAAYESAVVGFRQTLYGALGDVENALSARTQYAAQAGLLEKNLAATQASERLYEVRYRAGYVALKDWLDAQENRRTAEIALAENRYNRLTNQMTLYIALGGDLAAAKSAGPIASIKP